jgi:hypothetical protein
MGAKVSRRPADAGNVANLLRLPERGLKLRS